MLVSAEAEVWDAPGAGVQGPLREQSTLLATELSLRPTSITLSSPLAILTMTIQMHGALRITTQSVICKLHSMPII